MSKVSNFVTHWELSFMIMNDPEQDVTQFFCPFHFPDTASETATLSRRSRSRCPTWRARTWPSAAVSAIRSTLATSSAPSTDSGSKPRGDEKSTERLRKRTPDACKSNNGPRQGRTELALEPTGGLLGNQSSAIGFVEKIMAVWWREHCKDKSTVRTTGQVKTYRRSYPLFKTNIKFSVSLPTSIWKQNIAYFIEQVGWQPSDV